MFASTRISGRTQVATLGLSEHDLDVGGRERMLSRQLDGVKLARRVPTGLTPPGRPQHLADPLGHRHPVPLGDRAELGELMLIDDHLQPPAHHMSISDSLDEHLLHNHPAAAGRAALTLERT